VRLGSGFLLRLESLEERSHFAEAICGAFHITVAQPLRASDRGIRNRYSIGERLIASHSWTSGSGMLWGRIQRCQMIHGVMSDSGSDRSAATVVED